MECKKWAAIHYYKKTGKSVQQADAEIDPKDLPDDIDLQILAEQIDFFGSLEEHLKWQQETNDGTDNDE